MSRNTIISISHPPRQLLTWEYHRRNRTIVLYLRDINGRFWSASGNLIKKSTLITGFQTCNEHGISRGSKPVCIGDSHMGLISRLHCLESGGAGASIVKCEGRMSVCVESNDSNTPPCSGCPPLMTH